jgi:two-component system, OmpR family, sensor kinase
LIGVLPMGQSPADRAQEQLLRTFEALQTLPLTEMRATLTAASQLIAEIFGAEKVDVFLYQEAGQILEAVGTSDTPLGRRQHAIGLNRLPLANGGRTAQVFRTGTPFRDGHVDQDQEELLGVREGLGVRSTIAVPLIVSGACIGVVQAVSPRPEAFSDQDLRLLGVTARWVGLLLERAQQGRETAATERMMVLAHDLRNLLAPLRGRLELLARRARREGHDRNLQDANGAIDALSRITRLTTDLLDAARLEQGLFTITPEPFDLAELVRETVAAAGPAETPIRVDAPPELVICADPGRLRQALENLLANAIKHSPPGAAVEVTVGTDPDEAGPRTVLSVADRGPGIAPELLPRLFARFAAGPGSPGLGLGLYLAHGIVAAHGGTLVAESAPGTGARFVLTLPGDAECDGASAGGSRAPGVDSVA